MTFPWVEIAALEEIMESGIDSSNNSTFCFGSKLAMSSDGELPWLFTPLSAHYIIKFIIVLSQH
jgi:hypothetical protein